ncbi:sulfurtransferase TusA family protein [Uliginosibacterium sp. 31-12]|uniref:sulfurtransferase TusA family protein n=1 Tax=Uliginosibacterium sp. 31-12 TaxID=3062781 RepID=UPI0026E34B55|nr:sulfurtransferase TusA family protein [Uliginosibacterium sp. 31-12]MDO6384913.1 sulfurtransferase TusA family protein [Uliginosibacterium sp. 31-12]
MSTSELDVRGLKCPLPILRTKKALAGMASGQLLRVLATDPSAKKDFEAFARQTGHELEDQSAADAAEFIFLIRRK